MAHETHIGGWVHTRGLWWRHAMLPAVLLLAACGGGDSDQIPNTPLSIPMALVVNQEDTTMTTLRLDGKGTPVISTLSLGPAQADAIGGVGFSLGEWIFVTHTAGNRVAYIDPIGGPVPILENYLVTTTDPRVGLQPKRIYRDPVDKEVLWTMNEGEDPTCQSGILNASTVSVLHNSHIAVGGDQPHIKKTSCLFGKGEQFAAFSRFTTAKPGLRQTAFVSSKDTGSVTTITADPADGANRWSTLAPVLLCDSNKESPCNPFANQSKPAGMFWSQATGMIYAYLSGYQQVVEIDPGRSMLAVARRVDLPVSSHAVGITPNGQSLLIVIEDRSDQNHVVTRFASIDLTQNLLTVTPILFPILQDIRPGPFQFTPSGRQLYLLASNDTSGLSQTQVATLRKDLVFLFDPSTISLVSEIPLLQAQTHAMDLWTIGPAGQGSAKGVVVTNATAGVNGTVSLIDATVRAITATFPVGRNPKQVTVYYPGLAASDNQATPTW